MLLHASYAAARIQSPSNINYKDVRSTNVYMLMLESNSERERRDKMNPVINKIKLMYMSLSEKNEAIVEEIIKDVCKEKLWSLGHAFIKKER